MRLEDDRPFWDRYRIVYRPVWTAGEGALRDTILYTCTFALGVIVGLLV